MKKAILALVIVVMVSTPCFAEVETEGFFSVEGTLWGMCAMEIELPSYSLPHFGINCDAVLGFYQGKVYFGRDSTLASNISFNDLSVVSILYSVSDSGYFLAIMQPTGLGVFSLMDHREWVGCQHSCVYKENVFRMGIMFKINDNWQPPVL